MKHISIGLPALLILFFTFLILSTGCRENTIINSRVSPTKDSLGVYSTYVPCLVHSYFDDTSITSTNIGLSIYQAVGSYEDPFFGIMTGATFFQVVPLRPDSGAYTGETIDSAVLVLPYSGFTYGDTTNTSITQSYQVFYMTDSMGAPLNSTYFSYNTKPIDALNPLSDPYSLNIYHLKDSFALNYYPQNHSSMRIPLKLPALMKYLRPAQNVLTATSTNPFQDFISAFNGICVRVADTRQSTSAIVYFQLDGADAYSQAGIMVYHHTTGTTVSADTFESYYFNTNNCTHFNNLVKTFNHYPVNNLLHTTQPGDIVALQNQPGPSLDILIPGMKSLPTGIITKAEIQLTLVPGYGNYVPTSFDSILMAPERVYPVGVSNGVYPSGIQYGLTYTIGDLYKVTSQTMSTVVDGYLHSYTRNGKTLQTFTLDIPREVMNSILAKNDTLHLQVTGTQDFYGAFHMVAGGNTYPDTLYRPKLFVVYSKLN